MTYPLQPNDFIDPSSREPVSKQNPELRTLLKLQITMDLMGEHYPAIHSRSMFISTTDYVVDRVVDVTCHALNWPHSSSAPSELKQPSLTRFVTNVIVRSRVPVATILVTLAYLDKARGFIQVPPSKWICERIFLGAFLAAHKVRHFTTPSHLRLLTLIPSQYTNDSWMRAKTWAQLTGVFAPTDVVRVEREFLSVLEFNLRIDEDALLVHYSGIMARCAPHTPASWNTVHKPTWSSRSPPVTNLPKPVAPVYAPAHPPQFDIDCSSSDSSCSASPLDTPPVCTPNSQSSISPCHHGGKSFHPYKRPSLPYPYQLPKHPFVSGSHITSDSFEVSVNDIINHSFPLVPAAPFSEKYNLSSSRLPAAGSHPSRCDPYSRSLPHITEIIPPSILYPASTSSTVLTSWP
ncbi:hypothetical protein NLI96_g11137 [Meripilus lineatus]|uniref:Cyclin N-terminal domain-containing protein n=1 Tax=Meripilus lineatus TaxID=2056292 RepID=A0AAD5YDN6_9APHY|nr:hypothetical protein NLI96_g11137 [Physisporinus lineatus]